MRKSRLFREGAAAPGPATGARTAAIWLAIIEMMALRLIGSPGGDVGSPAQVASLSLARPGKMLAWEHWGCGTCLMPCGGQKAWAIYGRNGVVH